MKIDGNQVILDKQKVSDWLCYELVTAYTHRRMEAEEEYLARHLTLLEGALGVLDLSPRAFKEIFCRLKDPTDENISQAYQEVVREFGPSNFNFLEKLGKEVGTDEKVEMDS